MVADVRCVVTGRAGGRQRLDPQRVVHTANARDRDRPGVEERLPPCDGPPHVRSRPLRGRPRVERRHRQWIERRAGTRIAGEDIVDAEIVELSGERRDAAPGAALVERAGQSRIGLRRSRPRSGPSAENSDPPGGGVYVDYKTAQDVRAAGPMPHLQLLTDDAPLRAEHRGERAGVEDDADRFDLPGLDLQPLRDECGSGGRIRHHLIQKTNVTAIDECLLHVDAGDDRMQFLKRLEVWLRPIERVERTPKREIVVQQLARRSDVSLTHALLERLDDLQRIGHEIPSPSAAIDHG